MTSSQKLLSGSIALLAFLSLSACSSAPHTSAEKYYLVATNIKIPYWQEAGAGMVKAAKDLGVQAELVGPETFSPEEEKQAFRSAVAKKPAGILVSPSDPKLLIDDINAAIAAGIPVITVDSDAPASKRLVFVGTNNYQAGVMGGRLLASKLGGKGNIVFFTIAGQANVEERLNGYREALEAHPGLKIAEIVDIHGDASVAFDKTSEIIDKQRDAVDAFVSLEAQSGSEVAEVLDRKSVSGKLVVAMDTMASTLTWIEKGRIAATISQKPYTMAYYGMKMLADAKLYPPSSLSMDFARNSQSPLPAFVDTGSTIVDASSLAAFRQAAAAK